MPGRDPAKQSRRVTDQGTLAPISNPAWMASVTGRVLVLFGMTGLFRIIAAVPKGGKKPNQCARCSAQRPLDDDEGRAKPGRIFMG